MGFWDRFRSSRDSGGSSTPAQAPTPRGVEPVRRQRSAREAARRAQSFGVVHRSEYLPAEDEEAVLAAGPDGLPNVHLERVRDRMLIVSRKGWVNPRSRNLHRFGLFTFLLAGTTHHAAAVKAGRFTPGAEVELVREPDNPHDKNAVAVRAIPGRAMAGYVPATQARRLAKLMDSGVALVAVSTRGASAGRDGVTPQILVCDERLMKHLRRNL